MKTLNFPPYHFRFKKNSTKEILIFDIVRKKWLILTPEEWVRQHWIHFFITELEVPSSLIVIESGLKVLERQKRCDLLIYKNNIPVLLLECKAPEIPINIKSWSQILQYNRVHQVKYLLLSNGINHYPMELKENQNEFQIIQNIPKYNAW